MSMKTLVRYFTVEKCTKRTFQSISWARNSTSALGWTDRHAQPNNKAVNHYALL